MKKLLTLLPIFLIVSLVATGCQPEKDKPKEEPTTEQTNTTDPEEEPIVKKSDADDVGPELRHDAYRYYGLGNQKAFVYELDQSTGMVEEGSQEFAYQGMVDGVPTYKLIRKGSLSMLGEETYTLGTDGISMVSTTMGELSGPALTVPADLSVGATWSSTQSITRADGSSRRNGDRPQSLRNGNRRNRCRIIRDDCHRLQRHHQRWRRQKHLHRQGLSG